MGVYIPNMKMPNSCGECQFICKESTCRYGKGYERSDFCPLVEVPKHGRLIDADALIKQMTEEGWADGCGWADALDLALAPTIIESEE